MHGKRANFHSMVLTHLTSDIADADAHLVLRLAAILNDRKPHKAAEMAFQLKVHSRTVRRWLRYMREELKLPIQHNRHGFYLEEQPPESGRTPPARE